MVLRVFSILGALILVVCFVRAVQAHQEPVHRQLPNFDRRPDAPSTPTAAASGKTRAREAYLTNRTRRLERGGRILPLQHFYSTGPYLHRPDGMRRGRLAAPGGQAGQVDRPPAAARESVESFLEEQKGLLGFGAEALESGRLLRDQRSPHHGMRTLVWQQVIQDIDVYEGVVIGHVSDEGDLISLSAQLLSEFEPAPAAPGLDAARAIQRAAQAIEEPDVPLETIRLLDQAASVESGSRIRYTAPPLPGDVWIRLVWLPVNESQARLCWEVELVRRLAGELYRVLVDADTGEILIRHCRTYYLSEATYRVFTSDSPQPLSPGHPEPSTNQPPRVSRTLVTLDALSTNASPTGWIHDGDNETRGNNVEAHLDRNGDNLPDLPRPTGSPARVFDFPMDLDQSPATYGDATAVQLFYWANWMHDRLYELGFTEAAGNFQKDNFGRGGMGGDPLIADAQDGSGFNNANYSPRPDGISPRIQMFLFNGPEPDRDGGLDADIVLHEYTHGLSDRLVGGGIGITALQTLGMGEGWSDFYAIALLSEPDDDPDGNYVEGGYATYQFQGLTENYYYGIRRYPYTTDMGRNPLTFKDIDPGQISAYPEVPRSPNHPFDPGRATSVHRQGEVWCVTLWEARANLIAKHGFEQGNRLILQLVTDGMKLSPPNPTFLQARDAILLADRVGYGGENQVELWEAFAKRGMGVDAVAPPNTTTSGVVESFNVPDTLTALPISTQYFSGPEGGWFEPLCRLIEIHNPSDEAVAWEAAHTQSWFELSTQAGTIPPGGTTELFACLRPEATLLPVGGFTDAITISNLNTGAVLTRFLQLQVMRPAAMPFQEDFESGTLRSFWTSRGSPLSRSRVTASPEAREGEFHLAMDGSEPVLDVDSAATLMVDLNGYTNVTLRFWARQFNDQPDAPPSATFIDYEPFDGVAVSDDGITWHEIQGLRALENYYTPVEVDLDAARSALGLNYNGQFRIRFHHRGNDSIPRDGIAVDDITIEGIAPRRFQVELPAAVREFDGTQIVDGRVRLPVPAEQDITVSLASTDPTEATVPATALLAAGTTEAVFPITILDDADLDGAQTVTVRASAPGYLADEATMEVLDDESARLILAMPARVREGQGILPEAGLILVDQAPQNDIPIVLSSPDTTEIIVPARVILPAGETSVPFDVWVVDDGEIDGDQSLVVSVSVANWAGDQDVVVVEDNEHRNLVLSAPLLLNEANALLPNAAQVSIAGTLPFDLTVALQSSHPARITIPATALIPAGSTRVNFPVTTFDDTDLTATEQIQLTATAEEFSQGTVNIRLLDNEQAPSPFAPRPPHLAPNVALKPTLEWKTGVPELIVNGGFESGSLFGWFSSGSLNGSFAVNDGTLDPAGPELATPPYAGAFSAVSRQIGPGRQELFQEILIPATAGNATMTWVHRIRNHAEAFATNQSFRVEVRNLANQILGLAYATQPGDPLLGAWTEHSFDLTPWRGLRVRVVFVEEDELGFMNVHLDEVRAYLTYPDPTLSEVYFGIDPSPGKSEFQGITTNTSWELPVLDGAREYFWRIVARRGAQRQAGPVWSFRTQAHGALDHFTWELPTAAPEFLVPFPATITARDSLGLVLSNYHGAVQLSASRETAITPVQILVYTRYSDSQRQPRRTMGSIAAHFTNFVYEVTDASDPAQLQNDLEGKHVFLILDQRSAPAGLMEQLGREWQPVLEPFIRSGGVVIANSYLKDEHQLLSAGELFPLVKTGTADSLRVSTADTGLLTDGLPPSFEAFRLAAYETSTHGTALLTGSSNEVIAASRPLGDGLMVMIGSDFATNRTALDRLLANAIRWPQRDTAAGVAMNPSQSGFFIDGRWEGEVTIREAGPNILLRAENPAGIVGMAGPLRVVAANDLSLLVRDSPDPLRIGERLVMDMEVINSGPDAATGVTLTNQLPPGLAFESAQAQQGSCTHSGGLFQCDLGELSSGQSVRVELAVRPVQTGTLTNVVHLSSQTPDAFPANNTASTVTRVNFPTLTVSSTSIAEGNGGTPMAVFHVDLTPANPLEVRCDVATADGSAAAGRDYQSVQQSLAFPPGTTRRTVSVPILTDTLHETTELFVVRLSQPVNASILTPQSACTILDDDAPPSIIVTDATVGEGPLFVQTNIVFDVQLSGPSGRDVTIQYATADAGARAGEDYLAAGGTLLIPEGATSVPLWVAVLGDDAAESNETFTVRFFNAAGAELEPMEVTGTIWDDDAAGLDHFTWSEIPSPQYLGESFSATVTARDSLGNPFTGEIGRAALSGFEQRQELEVGVAAGSWEFPMGTSFHDQRVQSIFLNEELGGPARITGLSLNVTSIPGLRLQDWTIRLKHTTNGAFISPAWEQEGWTVVYRLDQAVPFSGWKQFEFETPFEFNGTDNLLIDWSFNNDAYAPGGLCAFVATEAARSITFETDSGFGDPLAWQGSQSPTPNPIHRVPLVRFHKERSIDIHPDLIEDWAEGTWTGVVTVNETSPLMALRVRDATGRDGVANDFSVTALNDLGISAAVEPDPVLFDGLVTLSLLVTNTGPGASSNVVLSNETPASLIIQSVSATQGNCLTEEGRVRCFLGNMAAETEARVTITALSRSFGLITNRATVVRSETESYLDNNTVSLIARAQPPTVSIADAQFMEQDDGTNDFVFEATLSNPTELPVTVAYTTVGMIATNAHDFVQTSGVLHFEPFVTGRQILVPVRGDLRREIDETFTVVLSHPTNAVLGRAVGVGTILDNDPLPVVSTENFTIEEGDTGTTTFFHSVTLSQPSGILTWVDYASSNGTAVAGADYQPVSGRLFFPPGLTQRSIFNSLTADEMIEDDEDYTLHLYAPMDCVIGQSNATITIVNDDGLPGVLDHFVWQRVGATQFVGEPFFAQLEARDSVGGVATNFNGFADVQARTGPEDIVIPDGDTTWNIPLGSGYHDARSQSIHLAAEMGGPSVIHGLALDVVLPPLQSLHRFTIRMKHTPLNQHPFTGWEPPPWTTLYQQDTTITQTGWHTFVFDEPFAYNGTDNLMVDLSFNNDYYTLDGHVRAGTSGNRRALYQQADSDYGDPLQWSGTSSPVPSTGTLLPAVKFILGEDLPMSPSHPLELVAGRWSGELSILQSSPALALRAEAAPDVMGFSNPFAVVPSADSDEDGLADEWELLHFGSLTSLDGDSMADPDGDGADNLEEYRAGTDPQDASSVFVLTGISVDGTDVLIRFETVATHDYLVQVTSDLRSNDWLPLSQPVDGTGGTMEVRDAGGALHGPRFYRVLSYR